ncbi:unnamed protein product [Urochloa decumbens]|uniref:Uncharacterized protein n=1 Tax=Urochloa decumbens TaxID=240449 RepID=A0ABC8W641_9POAL
MAEAAAAAVGGGCREARKRAQVDGESLLTEKKVKANCWERSENAYVEAVRERGRARSLESQARMAMVDRVLARLDELLYKLKNK